MLKKTVTIAGRHNTSISIEDEFWKILQNIAQKDNVTINDIVTKIDAEKKTNNLSSAIRIYILNYIISNR